MAKSLSASAAPGHTEERTLPLPHGDHVILEVARAVGLRPQANPARHWWLQHGIVCGDQVRIGWSTIALWSRLAAERVFQGDVAVKPGFEVGAVNRHLQLVPGVLIQHERLGAIAELHRTPDAIVEFPQRHVVFRIVVANGQPVSVSLHIEENAGTTVGLARNRFEFQADGAIREIVHALEYGHRVVSKLLGIVHQLFVRGAVELARAFDQEFSRVVFARYPGTAINHDDLILYVLYDYPGADHRLKGGRG